MPAPLDFKSALTVPLAKCSAAFACAFEGYFMPVADDPQAFASLADQARAALWLALGGAAREARLRPSERGAGRGCAEPALTSGWSHPANFLR